MVCYSLNARDRIRCGEHGFPVASHENEVRISRNLLLDFDLDGASTPERVRALDHLLTRQVKAHFLDQGFREPVRAFSGGGYHLLAAYGPIDDQQHPDLREQLRSFRNEIGDEFRQELSRLEVTLDRTQDLRRMVKIYGTAKIGGVISRFYGGERQPDPRLRKHLASMTLPERAGRPIQLPVDDRLPASFSQLLANDVRLDALWRGTGKPSDTDTTRSGYDYAVVRRALRLGVTDLSELATILALRPEGGVRSSGKREDYIRRTIAAALTR